MASTVFVNGVTLTDAGWFNDVNRLVYTICADPADLAALRATLGIDGAPENQLRAWLRYNGQTTTVISSFNIAAVTYNAVGDYTANLTDGLDDIAGCAMVNGLWINGSLNVCIPYTANYLITTGTVGMAMQPTGTGEGTSGDTPYIVLMVTGAMS